MSESAAVSSRLIGEIFVERGLITHDQLAHALELQKGGGGILGEILVNTFGVSRIELASVLAEQWSEMERQAERERPPEAPARVERSIEDAAAEAEAEVEEEPRRPIGEIFVERGMVTEEQLEHALELQRESGERLGEILVRLGAIGRLELAGALAEQWSGLQKLRPPAPRRADSWQNYDRPAATREAALASGAAGASHLDDAVSTLQQQVAALASRPDPDLASLRAMTRAVEERLAATETLIAGLPGVEALGELRTALERIDVVAREAARADELVALRATVGELSVGPLAERLDELAGAVASLNARLESHTVQEPPSLRADVDDVRGRLGALTSKLDAVSVSLADAAGSDANTEELEQRIGSAVGAVERRIDELVARLDAAPHEPPGLDGLREDVATVAGRLDELSHALGERVGRAELDSLVARVAQAEEIAQRQEERARDVVSAQLEQALSAHPTRDELQTLVEGAVAERPGKAELDGVLAELARRVDELAERVSEAAPAGETASLHERLSAVQDEAGGRVDALGARLADLASALEELRLHIEHGTGPVPTSELVAIVSPLADRIAAVEHGASGAARGTELAALAGDLNERLESMRAAVEAARADGAQALDSATLELRSWLDALQARVDEGIGRAELIALRGDLVAQLDALRAAMAERATDPDLTTRVDELASELGPVRAAVDRIHQEVEEARGALYGRLDVLEARTNDGVGREELASRTFEINERLDKLAREVADAGRSPIDPDIYVGLVGRVDQLAAALDERVGRGELASLEGDLTARVHQLAQAVADAAPATDSDQFGTLAARLDGLAAMLDQRVERAELDARAAAFAARLDGLADTIERIGGDVARSLSDDHDRPTKDQVEQIRGALAELAARVDSLGESDAIDARFQQAASRFDDLAGQIAQLSAVEASLGDLRTTVEHRLAEADPAATRGAIDALATRLDQLATDHAAELEALAAAGPISELHGSIADLRGWLGSLQERLEGAVDSSAIARVDETVAALHARLAGVATHGELHRLAETLSVRTGQLESAQHELQEAAAAAASGTDLAAIRVELGTLRAELEGGLLAARSADATELQELRAAVAGLTDEIRGATGQVHVRIDELAAGQGHFGGRLAAIEQAAATPQIPEAVAAEVNAVRAELEQVKGISEAQAEAIEKALRKGLAGLGDRIVASEEAYLEAGSSLRRAVERLGAAVVEADARLAQEPLDPPANGYVAFLPTPDGYRLVALEGFPPAVDAIIEPIAGDSQFRVVRATISPLPLDRRACVYLERIQF